MGIFAAVMAVSGMVLRSPLLKSQLVRYGGAGLTVAALLGPVKDKFVELNDSDTEKLLDAVISMMDSEDLLWPVHRRGDNKGQPISPQYMVWDMNQDRGWFSSNHFTKGHVDAAFKRGVRSGQRRERRRLSDEQAFDKT